MTNFSVIIPTWNEEIWLPRLLESLRRIDIWHEIIIADHSSSDRTVAIAEAYNCRVVPGGIPSIARNCGAMYAHGDILVFIDADVILTKLIVPFLLHHFRDDSIVMLHFPLASIGPNLKGKLAYSTLNAYIHLLSFLGFSQGMGAFMAVRKTAFIDVGGFNEGLKVGEDADIYRKLAQIGVIKFEKGACVFVSPRRFRQENLILFGFKGLVWSLLRGIGIKWDPFNYKWKPYPADVGASEALHAYQIISELKDVNFMS